MWEKNGEKGGQWSQSQTKHQIESEKHVAWQIDQSGSRDVAVSEGHATLGASPTMGDDGAHDFQSSSQSECRCKIACVYIESDVV